MFVRNYWVRKARLMFIYCKFMMVKVTQYNWSITQHISIHDDFTHVRPYWHQNNFGSINRIKSAQRMMNLWWWMKNWLTSKTDLMTTRNDCLIVLYKVGSSENKYFCPHFINEIAKVTLYITISFHFIPFHSGDKVNVL